MVMGALYVIFLPFIGFAMLFAMIARKAAYGLRALAARPGQVAVEKENA